MALQKVDVCEADIVDQNEKFGAYGGVGGKEVKSVFQDRTITIQAGVDDPDKMKGFVCTFANTGLVGTQDYYDPVSLGKPVIGNFITPLRFDWKLNFTSPFREVVESSPVRCMVTFRLLFLLVWEFPRDIVLNAGNFLKYFLPNSTGNYHQSYLYPDVNEKCVVLYDCNHTIGGPSYESAFYGNVIGGAGGQAGYVVPPFAAGTNPGWIVPAASIAANTTTLTKVSRAWFGGHEVFMSGTVDMSGVEAALWRDPEDEEEQQIVPCVMCFVVCQDLFHYSPSGSYATQANRPTSTWQFYTRLTFTDD